MYYICFLQELGIQDSLADMAPSSAEKAVRQKRLKKAEPVSPSDMRRSDRPRTAVNYCEDVRPERAAGPPKDNTHRIEAVQLDHETAERLRLEAEERRANAKISGKSRGPVDSGKGVRVVVGDPTDLPPKIGPRLGRLSLALPFTALQGGKVYDSKFGVTCHW